MTLSARMILVLTCVGLISGGFLAGVGIYTKERIEFNKAKEIENAIFLVIPGIKSSEKLVEDKEFTVYAGKDENDRLSGYAILATGTGFQDKITLMFGVSSSLTRIFSLTVLNQLETPGLGAKITDHESFLKYWQNKDSRGVLSLKKPAVSKLEDLAPSEVNTITGATISSEAILNIVNLSLDKLRELQGNGKLLSEEDDAC